MKILDSIENLTGFQKFLVALILVMVFYLASAAASYAVFSRLSPSSGGLISSAPGPGDASGEDPGQPRTEACPLNGRMHTKKAKEEWVKRRPLAVMIENHQESRPQSGLSSADIIYEAVAEGGITRFMGVYYCNIGEIQVGPVRSARTYFLDWLGEYDALYAHVGGANTPGPADALSQIIKYGVKDLNQFSIGFPVFWRDYERLGHPVATEHTMYSTTAKLWGIGAKRGWEATDEEGVAWDENFTPWKVKEDAAPATPANPTIKVDFWTNQTDYSVEWNYDKTNNSYKRKNGGVEHKDMNTQKQLEARNIVIQFQTERNADDGYPGNVHLLYGTTGKGKALFFIDGKGVEGTWEKASRIARTKYMVAGKEVEFNRGLIWIQTVPVGNTVVY